MRPACACRHQEQAEFARRAIVVGDAGRDDDLTGGIAVEHGGLVAVEAPAVGRFLRRGLDLGEIEARRAFRMRERQIAASRRRSWAASPASAPRCRIPRSARRRSRRSRDRARRRGRARTLPSGCRSRSRRRRARHRPRRSAAPASRDRRTASRSPALKPSGSLATAAAMIGVIGLG